MHAKYSLYFKQEIDIIIQAKISDNLPPFMTNKFSSIEQPNINDFDLSTFSVPFQTIICKNPLGSALPSNNQ
jgi:hypothetical protein